jgi:SNF2 family DNA or RNA helicase
LTAVEIIKQKKVKTLVVCPLSIIETAWLEDINKFAPEINAVNLWRARKARSGRTGTVAWNTLVENCQVGIINFDSFKIIKDELAACGFEMLIIDESSFVKNPKAQITKELTKFADRLPYVYLMSGTPAPNSEEEFFSQVRMVDPFLFGRNFYLFKGQWFQPTDWTGFKFSMKPDLREEFKRRVAKVSDFVEKHKVLDLPDRTFNIRKVFLSDAERKA